MIAKYARQLSTTHPVIWELMWRGVWTWPFLLPHDRSYLALAHLAHRPSGLFLDVGANNGISALSFRRVNKTYSILSLEPDRRHEADLRRVGRRIDGFEYRLIGAGSRREYRDFFTPVYNSVALHTFTSADREQVKAAVTQSFGPKVGASITLEKARLDIVPIDELGLAPDIIKIDVEGLDTDVLLGAERTVTSARPVVMIEACHVGLPAFAGFCQRHDYSIFDYDAGSDLFLEVTATGIKASPGSNNVFLIPREQVSRLPAARHGIKRKG